MKTKLTILTAILFLSLGVFAQTPEKINYQAVARDLDGNALTGETVNIQFDIIQASTVVYSETQTLTTNQFGLFTAAIGAGTVVSGNFSTIDWGGNTSALQVTVNGDVMPSTQLLSVPYALYSKESLNGPTGAQGPAGLGVNWLGTLTTVPGSANLNDAYYNSVAGKSYIYDGAAWTIMAQDGNASGDDWGTQVVQTNGGNILGDGTTSNPIIVIDNDTSKTNELQTLNFNTSNKNIIEISNGNGISLSPTTPTVNQVLTWNGTNWEAQTASSGTDWLTGTGSDIYNNTDSVGIGTTNPKSLLQLGSYYHIFPLNMAANEDYSISTYNAYWDGATLRNTNTGASVVSISGDNNGTPQYSVLLYPSQPAGTNIIPIDPFPKFNLKGKGLAINKDNPDAALHVSSADSASIMMSDPDDGSQATLIYEVGSTEYVSLRAPAILSTGSYTLTYPSELPSVSGANLVSDLSGNLSWGAPATAAWSLGGNTGTALGTHFIGTIDAQGVDFRTNNISRMLISSTGNVGIGIVSPTQKLHIDNGRVRVSNSGINIDIYQTGTASRIETDNLFEIAANGGGAVGFEIDDADAFLNVITTVRSNTTSSASRLNVLNTNAAGDASLFFRGGATDYTIGSDANDNMFKISNGNALGVSDRFVINNSGFVGIGTSSPTGNLDIRESLNGDVSLLVNGRDVSLGDVTGGGSGANLFIDGEGTPQFLFNNGNVGIGTSSPSRKLDVQDNSSNPAVFIQQVGSGDALSVYSNTSSSTQTIFKATSLGTGLNAFYVKGNGKVGIGTTSPSAKLEVAGDVTISTSTGKLHYKDQTGAAFTYNTYVSGGDYFIQYNNNTPSFRFAANNLYIGEGFSGGGSRLVVGTSGDGSNAIANAWTVFSDRRFKENIQTIKNPLELVMSLHGVTYEWRKSGNNDIGFIAQEVEEIVPIIVYTDEKTGYKSVDYARMTPILIEAMQEQQKMIEDLQKEIELLKNKQ